MPPASPAAPPDTAADVPWPTAEGASPMLAQWFAAKAQHADALLFFRMGDFYELFFADAEAAAAALDIALTTRGEHQGRPIPMCGVPAHSHESYLARLIRKGFRVAICEQMEDPAEAKKRGYKSIVRREVTRIITPGTITEEALLDAWRANWLAAVAGDARGGLGLAWFDLSTGAFAAAPHDAGSLGPALARITGRLHQAIPTFYATLQWPGPPPLTGLFFNLGELLVVLSVFALWWSYGRGATWRVWLAAALPALVFAGSHLASAAMTGILAVWSVGLTLYLPWPLYAVSLWLAGVTGIVALRRDDPGGWAILLLISGGYAPQLSLQAFLGLIALWLLAEAAQRPVTAQATAPHSARRAAESQPLPAAVILRRSP